MILEQLFHVTFYSQVVIEVQWKIQGNSWASQANLFQNATYV